MIAPRLAIIGCGQISEFYVNSANFLGAKIVRIFDQTPLNRLSNSHPELSHLHTSIYSDVLEDENIDCVIICLPNYLHAEYAKRAMSSGKHVCIEKPATLTYYEFLDLKSNARDNNVVLYTAYHRSFNKFLKRELCLNASLVEAYFHDSANCDPSIWYFERAKSGGGCIIDSAPNIFHALMQLGGPLVIDSVRILKKYKNDLETKVAIECRYCSGIPISISIDWLDVDKKEILVFKEGEQLMKIDFLQGNHKFPKKSMQHEYDILMADLFLVISTNVNFNIKETEEIMLLLEKTYFLSGEK